MKNSIIIYPLVCFIASAINVSADYRTLPINDTFTGVANDTDGKSSPGLNSAGWYFYNSSNGGQAWRINTDNTAPLSGNVLNNRGAEVRQTLAVTQWQSTTLSNVGDSISVSFDMRTLNATAGTGTLLSFSLLDFSTEMTANQFGNSAYFSGASGYAFEQGFNGTSGSYATVVGGTSGLSWNTVGGALSGLPIANNGAAHSYTLTLTRVEDGINVVVIVDGTPYQSYVDENLSTTSFNTLVLRADADWQVNTRFDNIEINFAQIPEGSTFAFSIGGGVVFLLLLRKRLKKSSR